ncbi:MAG: PAS domain S-box protein [Melioribacteraceae bacterium]|nr:PAS domain S-box protein [Melioribacteraceae bacterium]MCF8412567.1 PAS domain S-box protein [Melioribacteraceae bacterium]MCF8431034.1 PAS domain S-box protein [Melioribacteraceae bacterium]
MSKYTNAVYTYILFNDGNGASILSSYYENEIKLKLIAAFNEELITLHSLNEVALSDLKAMDKLKKESKLKTVDVSELLVNSDHKYLLIQFFKNDAPDSVNEDYLLIKSILLDALQSEETVDVKDIENQLFQYADTAILYTDRNGKKIFSNSLFNQWFGLTGSEMPSFTLTGLKFYNSNGKRIDVADYPYIKSISKNRTTSEQDLYFTDDSNTEKHFKVNSILIRDTKNEPEYVLSTFWDATKEDNIAERLKEAADNLEIVIYSSDADGKNSFAVSGSVQKLLGFNVPNIEEQRISLIRKIIPDDLPKFRGFLKNLRNGEPASVEYHVKDSDENLITIKHTGFPVKMKDKVERIVGYISNISNEKSLVEDLKKLSGRYDQLAEISDDLIFTLNSSGYFTTINNNGASLLGYSKEKIIGKHFLEFIDENEKAKIAIAFQRILNSKTPHSFIAGFNDKMERKVQLEVTAQPIMTKSNITGMLGVGKNITDQIRNENKLKELNSKLVEANRLISIERDRAKQQISVLEEINNLKNEFISNVSHELRTPLASIVGFAETIASDPELPREMITEFNEIMFTEAKRLARLINDVLDFSVLEAGEEELHKNDFDIVSALKEIVSAYSGQAFDKGIKVHNQIPESEIIIKADKDRISKAFGHVLSNAVKFTPSEGIITVIAQEFLNEVEIIVSDTGIGIPEEQIPILFNKFQKVYRPGSQLPGAGFGLASVKQIIDLHKGLVQVKSEPEKGTTVIIRLPKN